jgi:hypothetical protein
MTTVTTLNLTTKSLQKWWKMTSALEQVWILEAQCQECPQEVVNEVQDLWEILELGNDYYYADWPGDNEDWWQDENEGTWGDRWPEISAFFAKHNIKDGLIHYWW